MTTTARSEITPCPWCTSSDGLKLSTDGFGATMVHCSLCGCKGPPVPIDGDFDQTDRVALRRWSSRDLVAPLDPGLIGAVQAAVGLHMVLGSQLDEHSGVVVPYSVLQQIINSSDGTGIRGRAHD
ncbi:Lar family restriction alleviation protein [Sphingomonas montana]|uniref:Lar family restriction alleviation protein n=1 Tax=Sphingomonas montana TaxID=1843236 RepID=UPI00096D456B|nr:Lar family restriction alleviation protein [Sphingomonas montana]